MSAWQAEVPATTESSSSVHGQISTKLPGTEFAEEYLCPLDQLGLQGDDATYPETDIPPRGGASLAACGNYLYIFGGASRSGVHMNDMVILDAGNLSVSKRIRQQDYGDKPYPPAIAGHTCAVKGTHLVVFGGMNVTDEFVSQDTWVFNIENELWHKVEINEDCPSPRNGHTCVVLNGTIYIFGGSSPDTGPLDDMWTLEFTDETLRKAKWSRITYEGEHKPSERELHSMFLVDSHSGISETKEKPNPGSYRETRIAVYGGKTEQHNSLSDLHLFDLQTKTWKELKVSSGEQTSGSRVASSCSERTDAVGRVPIFGGWDGESTVFADALILQFGPNYTVSAKQVSLGGATGTARIAGAACMRTTSEEGYHMDTHYIFGGCGPEADTNNVARTQFFRDFT